MKDFVNGRPNV